MAVTRTLGGAWLGVHAPVAPRPALLWLLERGFRAYLPGAGPRAVDWRAFVAARESLPVAVPAVRVGGILTPLRQRPEAGLASANESDRNGALAAVADAVRLALDLGTNQVILEPGAVRVPGEDGPTDLADPAARLTKDRAAAWLARRNAVLDRALDAVCRTLHRCCKTFPDIYFCLTGGTDLLSLGEPRALRAIFDDLSGLRLSYWHDAVAAAVRQPLLGTEQGEWLGAFADRMVGVTVGDTGDGAVYALPGSGAVDYPLLASYKPTRSRPFPVALELDPSVEPAELPGAMAFLTKFGL